MVTKIQLSHVIDCDVDEFWRDFADIDFNRELFLGEMRYPSYQVLEQRVEGQRLWRRLEITPRANLPDAVAKIVGPALSFLEEGEYDGDVYRFKFLPPAGSVVSAVSSGVIRTERASGGATKRMVDVSCEVRMFGLGRMLENAAVKIAQEAYGAQAVGWNALLAKRRQRQGG